MFPSCWILLPWLGSLMSTTTGAATHDARPAASTVTYTNTRRLLFDSNGDQIDAYGSKVQFFNGSYYLYGNSFSTTGSPFGIKSYSSNDLEHWNYEGFLFDPSTDNPCSQSGGCGRPHIVYNTGNHEYILWANAGSPGYVVATSASPSGPFTFLPDRAIVDTQFDGLQPADFAVETLNGTAYIVFSALNFQDPRAGSLWPPIFQTLHVSELTSDYKNTTGVSWPVRSPDDDLIDQEAESPDIFVRDGTFYVAASNTCAYCNGSIGLLYRSNSIQGPWTRQIVSGYSCNGQVEGVLPLTDPHTGQVTHVWHSTSVPGGPRVAFGGHIFQPLSFRADGSVEPLDCSPHARFTVGFTPGSTTTAPGRATTTTAADATPPDAAYTAVCDSDQFDLIQTWRARRGGRLQSVSVNIARAAQTVPLTLTVFRFDSPAALVAPEFRYHTLGTRTLNATALSWALDTTTVPLLLASSSNASATNSSTLIRAGDLLGLAISGADYAPYCHLEFDEDDDDDDDDGDAGRRRVLYQRGAGQNSWRGGRGTVSPIYERAGKGVKFFATYA